MDTSFQQHNRSNRSAFLMRAYGHLFAAVGLFVAVQYFLFGSGLAFTIATKMLAVPWLAILGAFMVVGWLASRTAHRAESYTVQYLALVGFVIAEAFLFLPLLFIAQAIAPGVIGSAALLTLIGFVGLTAIAWTERLDFSFLGSILKWLGVVAIIAIVGSFVFGFELGVWFSVGMVAFAGAAILYDTSNILHHYPEDRYVAAALELFASIALMFWYLLRMLMSFSSD